MPATPAGDCPFPLFISSAFWALREGLGPAAGWTADVSPVPRPLRQTLAPPAFIKHPLHASLNLRCTAC
jgi:hypothetical protein